MKRNIIVLASLLFTLCICAQQARKDFEKDKNLSAGNYVAYPGPQKVLTPAPKGYRPFYISHYGRHGSRYLIGTRAYDWPYSVLMGSVASSSQSSTLKMTSLSAGDRR